MLNFQVIIRVANHLTSKESILYFVQNKALTSRRIKKEFILEPTMSDHDQEHVQQFHEDSIVTEQRKSSMETLFKYIGRYIR